MRFTQALFAGAALIAASFAVEINSLTPTNPTAGDKVTIKYSPADNTPTTFILSKGNPDALANISTLTTTATGGTYTWDVDSDLENGSDYALRIIQAGEPANFWGPFAVTGGEDAVSSSSASASASASTSASASASVTSSAASSLTSSVSGAISSTASHNGTVSSATLSTATRGTATNRPTGAATTGNQVPSETGAAVALGSKPFALIAGVVGALAYIH